MKAGVRSQLKIPDSVFRSGDVSTQSRKEKLQFPTGDPRWMWWASGAPQTTPEEKQNTPSLPEFTPPPSHTPR